MQGPLSRGTLGGEAITLISPTATPSIALPVQTAAVTHVVTRERPQWVEGRQGAQYSRTSASKFRLRNPASLLSANSRHRKPMAPNGIAPTAAVQMIVAATRKRTLSRRACSAAVGGKETQPGPNQPPGGQCARTNKPIRSAASITSSLSKNLPTIRSSQRVSRLNAPLISMLQTAPKLESCPDGISSI